MADQARHARVCDDARGEHGVGRREQRAEQERLGPGEPEQEVRGGGDDRGGDRHRDHELARGQVPLAFEHLALDLEAVAEQDHDQGGEREILDKAGVRAEVDLAEATRAEREAGEHEQRGERQERALREAGGERAENQQQAEHGGDRLEARHQPRFSRAAADHAAEISTGRLRAPRPLAAACAQAIGAGA